MFDDITDENLNLYLSLFRGRSDVFARYWEKDGRSGYSPAYSFDWNEFQAHRQKGGSIKTFENKKLVPISKDILKQHLKGKQALGVYPILEDNTSYFLAADFDGKDWLEDARRYMSACGDVGLYPYLERSKSGLGGHVWLFFSVPYPCYKSRHLGLECVRKALKTSAFEKEVSFDRLFPNQDSVIAGGFGNLIAFPLQGNYIKKQNTVFIDAETALPYDNQWEFLEKIHKHNAEELDAAYARLKNTDSINTTSNSLKEAFLKISVGNQIMMDRQKLTEETINFLRENLNFLNSEYLTRKRFGKSVYQVQKYFKLITESGDNIFLPRGFLAQLTSFLSSKKIPFEICYESVDFETTDFTSSIRLTSSQNVVLEKALAHEQGVIVAPPGSGKTMIGMEIIARRQLPTLILVHRKQLLDQWVDRIQTYLNIPKKKIGKFSGSVKKIKPNITVALLQSFSRYKNLSNLKNTFGTVIIDECHHIPAKTFREVITNFNPRYLYGLTATPNRKHNDEGLISVYIGNVIAVMEDVNRPERDGEKASKSPEIIIRETELEIPFEWKTDHFNLLTKIISFDTARNRLIAGDIVNQASLGNKILVLSERKEHLEILALCLKGHCEIIKVTGEDSVSARTSKLKQIMDGHYQVILSTGQFFGEGLHVSDISVLILAFPFSFEGKLIQYIGRLLHSSNPKSVIDYRDKNVAFLERQFKQRNRYYNKMKSDPKPPRKKGVIFS